MKTIELKEFINKNKYKGLESLELKLVKVEIIKEKMELLIFFSADLFIDEEKKRLITAMFKEYFPKFSIKLKISYNQISISEEFMEIYIEEIKSIIIKEIRSSSSWVGDTLFSFEDRNFIMDLPNQVAKLSLSRNGTVKLLKDKIESEINHKLKITYKNESNRRSEDFLQVKKDEEKTLAQNIAKSYLTSNNKEKKKASNIKKNFTIGKTIKSPPMAISEISLQTGSAVIKGTVFEIEYREIRGDRYLITMYVSDGTDSIPVKSFINKEKGEEFLTNIKEDMYLLIEGDVTFDSYSRCQTLMLRSLRTVLKEERMDLAEEKRVELHLHTQMSSMDGITNLKALAKKASKWGHKAIAITDHGVVQAFPEAMDLGAQYGLKFIYGVEGYLVNDKKEIISNYDSERVYDEYIVFDIETTGLSAINDEITEIGALKIKDGKIIDEFSQLINPGRKIPPFITKLTGITDEMVANEPGINEVIPRFHDFIGNSVLVAHNASFDVGFIREKLNQNNLYLDNPILDTLELARAVFPELKNHKLNTLAKHLDVSLLNHHRAVDDATATADVFLKIISLLEEKGVYTFDEINNLNKNKDISKDSVYHVVILAKNLEGLKNLYRLISDSHIKHFHRRPRIPKSLLENNRKGLLIGSACEAGELYKAIISNKSYGEIRDIVKFYDYLEIQPLANNFHLLRNGIVKDEKQLEDINKQILELGQKYNKPVVVTGDVHFLEPEDEVYRRILMVGQGFQDAENQPPLYFKTTDEMLEEFSYLGEDKAYEVVVKNTNMINDLIEDIKPIPDGTFPPIIEGSEEELKKITYDKAYEIYGNPLPEIVEERLTRELSSIIENGYAVMYIIAQKLVWKSLEDGYLVGSRGSVGSSFVATMSGITEVNPLAPHYVCPNCKYSEFFLGGDVASGSDLPDSSCPKCNSQMTKDGQDIPFEVFLGFEGDKEPDIDLNFAGEYQSKAHRYTEELFGEGYVFRAGTIGTIADKTAYGFVKKYHEQKESNVNPAEINRLVKGCIGIKRTSGQHPGGVMIVPKYKEILDFTPIQHPADDKKSGVITTHFDYNAISGRILKLDILGHDVPTIIKMLEEITKVDPTSIPLDEPSTMELFQSVEPLGIKPSDIDCQVGTLGIPEFGTRFVRQMLVDTRPNTFSELVRISGLSHGTDVWLNNAQDLVRRKAASLSQVISTREDIMLYLINAGLDKKQAFWIMENVRKGKGLSEEDEIAMGRLSLPDWYIDSCNKIKYMFPKAHAVAYVMMSFRIAFFKVHHPEAFYATYFTTKASDFDAQLILKGLDTVTEKIGELESFGNDLKGKERNLLTILEVVREMYHRGLKFENVDLYKSDSDRFIIGKEGILPPLKALEGVGENAARKLVEERELSTFISKEDLIKRTRVSRTVVQALEEHGCLGDIPESNQISLFSI